MIMDLYWIWFNQLKGISFSTKRKMLDVFKTPKQIYELDLAELIAFDIEKSIFVDNFSCESLDLAKHIEYLHERLQIKMITPENDNFISGERLVYFYKGELFKGSSCAVVGTRQCSAYGIYYTKKVCEELTDSDICINSGLARGIDKCAHQTALNSSKGKTQAFIATGLDLCYPREHSKLMSEIIEHGAVISPFAAGVMPLKYNFVIRNALMSQLSDKVVVTEAPAKSGSLLTASFAQKHGRPVYVVNPQSNSALCAGNRFLLKNGAKEYIFKTQNVNSHFANLKDNIIINAIEFSDLSTDEIREKTNISFDALEPALLNLEYDHLICYKGHGKWHYNGW